MVWRQLKTTPQTNPTRASACSQPSALHVSTSLTFEQESRLASFLKDRRGAGIAIASQDRRRKEVMEKQHKMREQAAKSKRALAVVDLAARVEDTGMGSSSSGGVHVGPGLEGPMEGPVVEGGMGMGTSSGEICALDGTSWLGVHYSLTHSLTHVSCALWHRYSTLFYYHPP